MLLLRHRGRLLNFIPKNRVPAAGPGFFAAPNRAISIRLQILCHRQPDSKFAQFLPVCLAFYQLHHRGCWAIMIHIRADIMPFGFRNWFRAIPHNSKCRYGERGAAAAKPKAQIILCVLSSILATQMPCRTPSRSEALRSATAACGGSWRGDPPERCLSHKAGIVRCCLRKMKEELPVWVPQRKQRRRFLRGLRWWR